MDQVEKVLVVVGIHFDEHVVLTGGEVAFHHFGNQFQLACRLAVERALLQPDADIGAGVVTQLVGID